MNRTSSQRVRADWQLARATVLPAASANRRLFFFDESALQRSRNIAFAYAPVERLGVLLEGQTEATGPLSLSTFCGSLVRLEDGRYRMYHTIYGLGKMGIGIADSSDGLQWHILSLGQRRWDGFATEVVSIEGLGAEQDFIGQPQVLRLPDGRWRMYFWHHHHGGYFYTVAHSEDGLRWRVATPAPFCLIDPGMAGQGTWSGQDGWTPGSQGQEKPTDAQIQELWRLKGMRTNDASYVYYNDTLERFEYYAQWAVPAVADHRIEADNMANMNRYIQRRVSGDGLTWSQPELVVVPDERDPWDQQFYHLAVQWHEDWMIGSLGHYRVENGQQTQDLELIFSRDGRRWQRPLRGGFIPRPEGQQDCQGVYAPNAWIDQGDNWLCLYGGTSLRHNEAARDRQARLSSIMGARWPKQRFVGLSAGRIPGSVVTEIFFPQQSQITLDASIRGQLRAELCDTHGRKHPGYHLMDSLPVTGDSPAHVLRWREKTSAPFQHDAMRLRLEWTDGEIYSLSF